MKITTNNAGRGTLCAGMIALAGCYPDPPPETDYSHLVTTPVTAASLTLADDDLLLNHIKNGLRLQLSAPPRSIAPLPPRPSVVEDLVISPQYLAQGSRRRGSAVLQGEHWFVATAPVSRGRSTEGERGIQVVAIDAEASEAVIVGDYTLDPAFDIDPRLAATETGDGGRLVMLSGTAKTVSQRMASGVPDPATSVFEIVTNGSTHLTLLDTSLAQQPQAIAEITIDGQLIASDKNGETLYLITQYEPWIPDLIHEDRDYEVREDNEAILENATLDDFLPQVRVNDSSRLITENCMLPDTVEPYHGFAHLLHITAVDMVTGELLDSVCVSNDFRRFNFAHNTLYLGGGEGPSAIHQFTLNRGEVRYTARGQVPGRFFSGPHPRGKKLIQEHAGYIQVMTLDSQTLHSPRLTVLEQAGDELMEVASLPNATYPDWAQDSFPFFDVHFEGDSAYLVTQRESDPIKVLDLSQPLDPKPSGEIVLPPGTDITYPLTNRFFLANGELLEFAGATEENPLTVPNTTSVGADSILQREEGIFFVATTSVETVDPTENGSQRDILQFTKVDLTNRIVSPLGEIAGQIYSESRPGQTAMVGNTLLFASGNDIWVAPLEAPEMVELAEDGRSVP